jgi:hypothetical protein
MLFSHQALLRFPPYTYRGVLRHDYWKRKQHSARLIFGTRLLSPVAAEGTAGNTCIHF